MELIIVNGIIINSYQGGYTSREVNHNNIKKTNIIIDKSDIESIMINNKTDDEV